MRGPGRPLLLGLLLVLGAAGPGVAEPREAADRQTLLRLIVEILQELKKYHSGESKRLHLLGQHDYTLGRREVSDYPVYPEEQRVGECPCLGLADRVTCLRGFSGRVQCIGDLQHVCVPVMSRETPELGFAWKLRNRIYFNKIKPFRSFEKN